MGILVDVPVDLLQKAGIKDQKNARLIVYGAIIVIGGITLFIIGKKIKNLFTGGGGYTQKNLQEDINNLDISSEDVTITEEDATLIASNLLIAMDRFGTDERAILDAMDQIRTRGDLLLVIRTFGVKLYSGIDLPKNALDRLWSTAKDLSGWLRAELSGSALAQVKEKFDSLGVPF
jgi:hypothetical protein